MIMNAKDKIPYKLAFPIMWSEALESIILDSDPTLRTVKVFLKLHFSATKPFIIVVLDKVWVSSFWRASSCFLLKELESSLAGVAATFSLLYDPFYHGVFNLVAYYAISNIYLSFRQCSHLDLLSLLGSHWDEMDYLLLSWLNICWFGLPAEAVFCFLRDELQKTLLREMAEVTCLICGYGLHQNLDSIP